MTNSAISSFAYRGVTAGAEDVWTKLEGREVWTRLDGRWVRSAERERDRGCGITGSW